MYEHSALNFHRKYVKYSYMYSTNVGEEWSVCIKNTFIGPTDAHYYKSVEMLKKLQHVALATIF
jgi:hypothetical protein